MGNFVKTDTTKGDISVNHYAGIELAEMAKKIHDLFIAQGYRLAEGEAGNGMYAKGSMAMRVFFGAMAKYFKFSVKTVSENNEIIVSMEQKSMGATGGLIGLKQVKNEMQRISGILQTL
jgi:hypothetical protein